MLATCDSNLDENPQVVAANFGSGETATLTEKLLPNESTTLTVWHHVKDRMTDLSYTITAAGGINENGTVYLDHPDIGISQMEVIAESAGKRTARMTLYNPLPPRWPAEGTAR